LQRILLLVGAIEVVKPTFVCNAFCMDLWSPKLIGHWNYIDPYWLIAWLIDRYYLWVLGGVSSSLLIIVFALCATSRFLVNLPLRVSQHEAPTPGTRLLWSIVQSLLGCFTLEFSWNLAKLNLTWLSETKNILNSITVALLVLKLGND
jgi:hypothetical protein